MDKRTMRLLRVLSVFCVLMAIGAAQVSIISAILMLIVSVGCLPGVQLALGNRVNLKTRAIVLVVLVVLALAVSQEELKTADAQGADSAQMSVSDQAES